jgi:hypothetical protein
MIISYNGKKLNIAGEESLPGPHHMDDRRNLAVRQNENTTCWFKVIGV